MKVVVKDTEVVKSKEATREVFSPSARQRMEEEIAWRKKALEGPVGSLMGGGRVDIRSRLQDPAEMERQMKDFERNLERGKPIKLTPEMKNELWLKAKRLKDEFKVGMLTASEVHPVSQRQISKDGESKLAVVADYDKMAAGRCVERNRAWYQKNEAKLKEFKRIMRILEPDDPRATDYERFRPKRKQ